jgi:hypothetical protein
MVKDEVWRAAKLPTTVPKREQFLHLTCLETCLGRRLTIEDFSPAPVNDGVRFGFNLQQQNQRGE